MKMKMKMKMKKMTQSTKYFLEQKSCFAFFFLVGGGGVGALQILFN